MKNEKLEKIIFFLAGRMKNEKKLRSKVIYLLHKTRHRKYIITGNFQEVGLTLWGDRARPERG